MKEATITITVTTVHTLIGKVIVLLLVAIAFGFASADPDTVATWEAEADYDVIPLWAGILGCALTLTVLAALYEFLAWVIGGTVGRLLRIGPRMTE